MRGFFLKSVCIWGVSEGRCQNVWTFFDHSCGCEGFVVLEASVNCSLEVIYELFENTQAEVVFLDTFCYKSYYMKNLWHMPEILSCYFKGQQSSFLYHITFRMEFIASWGVGFFPSLMFTILTMFFTDKFF